MVKILHSIPSLNSEGAVCVLRNWTDERTKDYFGVLGCPMGYLERGGGLTCHTDPMDYLIQVTFNKEQE